MTAAASWTERHLGELVSLTSGQSPSGFRFGAHGTPYYKVDQLGRSQKYLGRNSTPYFSTDLPRVPAGSVLIAKRGGAIALNRVRLTTEPSFMDTNVMALVPDTEIDSEFLFYWLGHRGLWDIADVTSVPQINNKHINPLEIALPVLTEQREIAGALRGADDLIAALERAVGKKQAIKQGIMQQLLSGRVRLSGCSEPWRSIEVGDYLEFKNGLNKSSEFFGSGTPIVNFMDVMNGPIVHTCSVLGRVTLTKDERKRFSARKGDLFFTRTSETVEEVGTAAVLVDDIPGAAFSGFILRGRPRMRDLDSRFLAYRMQLNDVRRQITSAATYTTRALTNGRSLSRIVFQMPSFAEQTAIAGVLADADDEIHMLNRRLAKSREIKSGMMQALLTGRTRLPVAGAAA